MVKAKFNKGDLVKVKDPTKGYAYCDCYRILETPETSLVKNYETRKWEGAYLYMSTEEEKSNGQVMLYTRFQQDFEDTFVSFYAEIFKENTPSDLCKLLAEAEKLIDRLVDLVKELKAYGDRS